MLAITQTQGLLLAATGAVLVVVVGLIIAMKARRPRSGPDIPAAMAPGPSDPDLEKPLLEKLQGWGIVLVAFFVIWIPVYWLNEPSTNARQEQNVKEKQIELGGYIVKPFSEENQAGFDCMRCHGPQLQGQEILAGDTVVQSANLTNVCQRKTVDEITLAIEQGQGEVMPSWSIKYEGAMNDQQVQALVQYLISIQEGVPDDQNKCLDPDAGTAESPAADAGTESPAPTDGASPAMESPAAPTEGETPVSDDQQVGA